MSGNGAPSSMAPALLPEQQRAVETRHVSVALSAGAGCGKTFVLTQRFLSHLDPQDDPAELSQLVAITFTDRAAREMRQRIRAEVNRRLREAPADEAPYWLSLLRRLHTARITTIHSFCMSLLRAHAAEAGLDPAFRTLDEVESSNLLLAALDDVLQRRLAKQDPGLMRLAVDFNLSRTRSMIQGLVRTRQQPWLEQWRGKTVEELLECWREFHREVVAPRVLQNILEADCTVELLRLLSDGEPPHAEMKRRRLALLECFEQLPTASDRGAVLQAIVDNARVQGAGTAKNWGDAELYGQYRAACTQVRDMIKDHGRLLDWTGEDAVLAAGAGVDLLELALEVREKYTQRKRAAAALDFDDLLIQARDLLHGEQGAQLRSQFAARTRLLLIDEFQDTDQVQVDLIAALADHQIAAGKVFLVGDMKQSIYRFRGAEPEVFRKVRDEIPDEGRLPLTHNFRSQPAILNFVNALFDADIEHYEPLVAHRPQITAEPAVEFLWAPRADESENVHAMRQREADWIARRLRELIDSRAPVVCHKGKEPGSFEVKPVEPGDIAILFRALSDVEHYESALRNYGIDYYLVGGHAFYSQQEVFDLVNLLRAIASPGDEISLAGALRSPFFSIRDEGLFWLARHREGLSGGLFAQQPPAELDAELQAQVIFARDTLLYLRERKDRLPVAELIHEVLDRTGYDAILLAEFLGERKLANLRKLIDMARSLDRSGLFTLSDFIAQLSDFVAEQPREALAATQAEASSAVRLMTIHQAKGLEFPLVVVPDLDRRANFSTEAAAFDRRLGPLVRLPENAPGGGAVCGHTFYQEIESDEEAAERMRLFYVATTRAADYLILSSSVATVGSAISPWMKLLSRRFEPETGELRCELPPDYGKPRVLVTSEEPPQPAAVGRTRKPDLIELVNQAKLASKKQVRLAAEPAVEPLPVCSASRRRYSFSQLTGEFETLAEFEPYGPAEESQRDAAREWNRADPLRLGTIVHAVLAEMDRGEPIDVAARVHHHADIEFRDDPRVLGEAVELIESFMASPRAGAIRAAAEVHTEIEFLLTWPLGATGADTSYLHGFLDCLYRDADGGWHIIDYKTSQVPAAGASAAAGPYEMQMLLYGVAAEKILGSAPQSLILHFLRTGTEHEVKLNTAARRKLAKFVDERIAALRTAQPVLA